MMNLSRVGIRGNVFNALIIAGCASGAFAQMPATMSGTVKDKATQAPIAGAMITLLSNPNMAATTDANGAFTMELIDPTGVRTGHGSAQSMRLSGTELTFSTGKAGAYARITLHDLRGHQVAVLKDAKLPEGDYTLSAAPANLTAGVYLVRAMVGNQVRSFRMSTLGGGDTRSFFTRASVSAARLAKTAAGGVDWLVVTKAGYLKHDHEVMAYTDAQAVVLEESKPATANLAIFTDSTMAQIDWANAAIYSWEQTAVLMADSSGKGFNNSKTSMNVSTVDFGGWNGWAFHVAKLGNGNQPTADLTPYANGALHMAVKGNAVSIGVMISSTNQGSGSAPLVDLSTHGYLPDSLWHEISIPVSEFSGTAGALNLADVFVYCGFVSPAVQGTTFNATDTYVVDDVYFTPTK